MVYVVVVGYKKCVLRTWSRSGLCVEDVVRGVVYVVVIGYKNCVLRTWSKEWFMLLWLVIRIVC